MKDGKAHMIILQKNKNTMAVIDRASRFDNPNDYRNHVQYCTTPGEVLRTVQQEPVDIIISGDRFYGPDTFFKMGDEKGSIVTHASGMAHLARMLRPDTLVIRYSSDPSEDTSGLVGDIDQSDVVGSLDTLVGLMTSPELPTILQAKDWKRLRREFPGITFYDTLDSYR